jgi:hypothetical protein
MDRREATFRALVVADRVEVLILELLDAEIALAVVGAMSSNVDRTAHARRRRWEAF